MDNRHIDTLVEMAAVMLQYHRPMECDCMIVQGPPCIKCMLRDWAQDLLTLVDEDKETTKQEESEG